jgi:hypothetical protein
MVEWRSVPGFNGRYEANRRGQIRTRLRKQLPLVRPHVQPTTGYVQIRLRAEKYKPLNRYVHRLIAATFHPNPHNKPEVNHKDGNRANNVASNLEWVTRYENLQHAKNILGRGRGGNTLSAEAVREIRHLRSIGVNFPVLARAYDASLSSVKRAARGRTWGHVK